MEVREPDFTFSALFIGGVKFPTGDSSRIKEEFHETEIEGAPVSGIHGHDLTLGTGSYDGILGGQTSLRYQNFFFEQATEEVQRSVEQAIGVLASLGAEIHDVQIPSLQYMTLADAAWVNELRTYLLPFIPPPT